MRQIILCLLVLVASTSSLFAGEGMQQIKSAHDVKSTGDRLEKVLKSKGMTVFARIDHALGAEKIGTTLRPTELVIFG
ncbi:MAG: hypothetical protein ACI9KN_001550 [Gammaproteobacteria bacterium]|jgi:uncharacterized protein (DUF302 family)